MTAIYPAQRQLATFSVDDLASSLGFAQIGRSERELAEALRAAFASTSGPSFTPAHAVHTSATPSAPLNTPSGTPQYAYFPTTMSASTVAAPSQVQPGLSVPVGQVSPHHQWSLAPANSPADAHIALPNGYGLASEPRW